jgi:hypothetical protein
VIHLIIVLVVMVSELLWEYNGQYRHQPTVNLESQLLVVDSRQDFTCLSDIVYGGFMLETLQIEVHSFFFGSAAR